MFAKHVLEAVSVDPEVSSYLWHVPPELTRQARVQSGVCLVSRATYVILSALCRLCAVMLAVTHPKQAAQAACLVPQAMSASPAASSLHMPVPSVLTRPTKEPVRVLPAQWATSVDPAASSRRCLATSAHSHPKKALSCARSAHLVIINTCLARSLASHVLMVEVPRLDLVRLENVKQSLIFLNRMKKKKKKKKKVRMKVEKTKK